MGDKLDVGRAQSVWAERANLPHQVHSISVKRTIDPLSDILESRVSLR
jgi:hypothetical protein